MSSNPIAHPQAAPGKRHLTALTVGTALAGLAIATAAIVTSRDNDSGVATVVRQPAVVQPVDIPVARSVDPPYQLVVVSSVDDLANARTLPGVELDGVITDYMVVNDESSRLALAEIEKFGGAPGMPPMSILDLR